MNDRLRHFYVADPRGAAIAGVKTPGWSLDIFL